MNRYLRLLFFTLVFFVLNATLHAQNVTLSNNLLYDATLTPNLRLGVRLSPHWSMGLTGGYRPWPTDENKSRKWKHLLVSPDLRYWTDSVNVHHFFGMNFIYSHYNVADVKFPFGLWKSVRDERRQGDLGAIGAYYGYSWPLGRYWNLEAHIGAAIGYTKFDRYECGHCGTKIGNDSKFFVLPQAGLSIVFNITGRPRPAVVEPMVEPVIPVVPEIDTTHVGTSKVEATPVDLIAVATAERTAYLEQLQREYPLLVPVSEYKPYDPSQPSRKQKGALMVHYPVAKYKVREDFRDNSTTLKRILDVTRKLSSDSVCNVKKIQIVGFASVEGGQWGNERLALRRANALKDYVQQHLGTPDSLFEVANGGEAWADLRDYVNDLKNGQVSDSPAVGMPSESNLQQVLNIIDREKDVVRREQKLRSLHGGRTWNYIRKVFRDHRNAGYIRIYFEALDMNKENTNK